MAKKLAIVLGIIVIIVGILGFVSNPIVGANGYFVTGMGLNLGYIIVGLILLLASSKGEGAAATWLKILGIVYLILFLDGLFQPTVLFNIATASSSDTWLHLILGIVFLIAGFLKGNSMMDKSTM